MKTPPTTDSLRNQQTPARDDALVNRVMTPGQWGLVGVLSIIWGGSFFFIGVAVKELPPLSIVLSRVGFAAVFLLLYVGISRRKMPADLKLWGTFFLMGLLNNLIPFCLIVWGQQYIQSGLASILIATTPIFSVVLAHFLTREERLTVKRASGVAIGWLGVAVLIGIESLKGFGIEVLGQLSVLSAAGIYAYAAIFGRRFKGLDPVVVSTCMLCASTLMILPLTLVIDRPWQLAPSAAAWGALFGLSAVSTSFAYIIYFRVLAVAGATNVMLVTFLVPVSAILLGVLVLGERLGWNAFGGMALIFAGLIAIDGRLLKRSGANPKRLW